jgi:hypothetical protein
MRTCQTEETTMTERNRLLDDIRIASPCTASWDRMTGDNTTRFCGECKLSVYNISAMTAAEAAALIERTEGRLCVRLHKRKDGTVLTRNCPVGLRAAARRATRAAGAALTAVLGLFSGVTAWAGGPQNRDEPHTLMGRPVRPQEPEVLMGKMAAPRGGQVTVSVGDDRGTPLGDAEVLLTDLRTGESTAAELDEDGRYRFQNVVPGIYTLNVSTSGHAASKPRTIRVKQGRPLHLEVTLVETERVMMGEIAPPESA